MAHPSLTNPDAALSLAQLLLEKSKERKPFTLSELLNRAKPSISKMLKNGHTYDDVAAVMAEFDIDLAPTEIEALLMGTKKVRGKAKGKAKESGKEEELVIEAEQAEEIFTAFEEKASIRKGLTKEELVEQLQEPIEKMLVAGYSYEDVAAVMADSGVQISGATIKSYYQGAKKRQQPSDGATGKTPEAKKAATDTKSTVADPANNGSSKENPGRKRLPEVSAQEKNELEKEFNL